jgi:6-phosphofructokinase 1
MTNIVRKKSVLYKWHFKYVNLEYVANKEKYLPNNFIQKDGFFVTQNCKNYLEPLISGENFLEYSKKGIPNYFILK